MQWLCQYWFNIIKRTEIFLRIIRIKERKRKIRSESGRREDVTNKWYIRIKRNEEKSFKDPFKNERIKIIGIIIGKR